MHFIFSMCPWGINTLHASPAYPSQFSMLLLWLHPQLLVSSLSPIFHCQSYPILLFISFKNQINMNMMSKEMTRLSNQINDLPEEIYITMIYKPIIEM